MGQSSFTVLKLSKVYILYLVIAYQWRLSEVDVHMAEMYGKNQAVSHMSCNQTDSEHY